MGNEFNWSKENIHIKWCGWELTRKRLSKISGLCTFKEAALDNGVIQLRVRVANLATRNEHLEALRQPRRSAMILGQWRHDLRVIGDKGGGDAVRLNEVANELVEQPRVCQRRAAFDIVLLALHLQELRRCCRK